MVLHMKILKLVGIPLVLVSICGWLLHSAYLEVKNEAIGQLNRQQRVMAREAARGIESFFAHYGELLDNLARQAEILALDTQGRRLLQLIYETHATDIKALTRLDAQGNILCTFPENPELTSLAQHEHVQRIIQTHQPIMSEVFTDVKGLLSVAYHVPVFDHGAFAGSLGVLIPFNDIARRFLDDIKIGTDGYAWMITQQGVEIYCPVPGHVGRTVFDNCRDFPTILAMANEMVQGREGATTYVFNRLRGQTVESITKHAVYLPIKLGNTFWSIVVATPADEVLGFIQGFRDRWFWVAGFLLIMTAAWAFYFWRAMTILKEEKQRQAAEEALISANQQLNDIIEFLPDATFVVDRQKRVIAWNKAIEEMTGVSKKEMIGQGDYAVTVPFYGERRPHLLDLLDKDDPELALKYQHIRKKGNILYSETFVPCVYHGQGAHVFATGAPLFDAHGNRVGAIESIRDITERKQAEEALAVAEEKYRGIFENAALGIFQTTPDGRILSANPAYARIYGFGSEEDVIHNLTDLATQIYVHPEQRHELMQILEEQDSVQEYEAQVYRKDRSIAWVSMNVRAVRDADGKLHYLEGTVQDITDRKALETRLIQAQKMEAIGTLAGGIAHDFNNILAAIIGYTEMTKSKLRQDELRPYLERVLEASERARNLVGQILTFSRSGGNEPRPIAVGPLIEEGIKLLRATLPTTIEIRQHIASRLPAIVADPTQVHQVLINLCTNAAHAMRLHGGVLAVTLEDMEVTPAMAAVHLDLIPGHFLKLTVADTGTGVAPEIVHRIFDPFFTTKNLGEGTGLGLSVVYGIIRGCGGTITVHSERGAGSVFAVYLPALEGHFEAREERLQPIPKGTGRVLLVDDEEMLVTMGRQMLEELGYEVTATTDSSDALELFRVRPDQFDLIITDMTMPGMTGVDLAKELLGIRPELPIILCTGYSELITEEKARAMGIQGFAQKPLSLQHLANLIAQVLTRRQTPA